MSFYDRKIPYYKSFKLIDSDGDGIKDTIVYRPISDFYYIQFGLEQDIKNIGHYIKGEGKPKFELVDFSSIWNEGLVISNPGHNTSSSGNTTTTPTPICIDIRDWSVFNPWPQGDTLPISEGNLIWLTTTDIDAANLQVGQQIILSGMDVTPVNQTCKGETNLTTLNLTTDIVAIWGPYLGSWSIATSIYFNTQTGDYTNGLCTAAENYGVISVLGSGKACVTTSSNGGDTLQPVEFCNDPSASNYDVSLVGVNGYTPCFDNTCCTYNSVENYKKSANSGYDELNCLAFYTDWGPWNDNLLLNDTQQLFIKKTDCTLTLRLINQLDGENNFTKGGWYGASVKIEIDEGNGFMPLLPGNTLIQNLDNDISFNQSKESYTLDNKVRIWKAKSTTTIPKYYTTKPYRDIILKPNTNTKVKITYINSDENISEYEKYAKYLRLQLIKGSTSSPTPTPPTPTTDVSSFVWSQNISEINTFLGTPSNRQNNGETFHYISNGSVEVKGKTWSDYLMGYKNPSNIVPWAPSTTGIAVGTFYANPIVTVLNDFGDSINTTVIDNSSNNSLNYFSNPNELLKELTFTCSVKENYVSYFDRNGDGFIEYSKSYPKINSENSSSVDIGLFSKTRYDSPYIFLKPGTKDNTEFLNDNPLTKTTVQQSDAPVGPSSHGGWKNYAYVATNLINTLNNNLTYSFTNVSPTCQLGGFNNLSEIDINLVDQSNSNIFLQQPYFTLTTSNPTKEATFGTGTTVPHLWNYGFSNAKGGCCAKSYSSSLDISTSGPYFNSKCSSCHGQMTPRSAQTVLDRGTKIAMQTTDSDVYYGPFYDPQNPTYNGYGLAFSKANKFCRDVKNKNGVLVDTSEIGVSTDALYVGGILHGGAVQYKPNTDFTNNYGVTEAIQLGFDEIGVTEANSTCLSGTKIPLKCRRVVNDPNCPSNNCMKCLFCFKCNSEDKQPGIFTGNNGDSNGPSDGITYLG
jgi:hypothetical protein